MRALLLAAVFAQASPVFGDESASFVEANLLGVFYHELGHAVIDLEQVPIFGQEEDAADVFSIYMIHALFDEEAAQQLAYDASFGFWLEAETRDAEGGDIAWWDEHGPDEQRFFNTVCIFYGGDPEARESFAQDMELPEDRAELCPFEFDQAEASWGEVLDDLTARGAGTSLVFDDTSQGLTAQILRDEIALLNGELSLAAPLTITIESCGEANAYYDPAAVEIVMCSEFEDHLADMAENL